MSMSEEWQESLKKLEELPKSKAQLKAEAKAEKDRLKAEAKAEKERVRMRKRAAKEAEQEERIAAQKREQQARKEAEERRRAEEEMRIAEERAEENRRKAEKEAAMSMQRAEEKAAEERLKAEKKAAVLAAVAASQASKGEAVAAESVAASAQEVAKAEKEALAQQRENEKLLREADKAAAREAKQKRKDEKEAAKAAEKAAALQAKEEKRRSKEAAKEAAAAEKAAKAAAEQAAREAAEQAAREAKEAKAAEKAAEKAAKEAAVSTDAVAKADAGDTKDGKKRSKWLLWVIIILLLLALAAVAYFFLVRGHGKANVGGTQETVAERGKHLDVPATNALTFNPDMIPYTDREIGCNSDIISVNMTEYINNYLAERDYRSARVPMFDRVRQYADERLQQLLGPRFAVQRFIPYEDYIYENAEPWLKQTYADVARHMVQGELMNRAALDDILDGLIDELGLQSGEERRTAAEVQQVKVAEQAPAVARKPKVQLDKDAPVYVYVEKASKQGFDIIAGFYLNKSTAAKMTARLHELGCDAYIIEKNDMYYVSMGSAPTRTKAEALYNHIKSWYDGDIVIKEL